MNTEEKVLVLRERYGLSQQALFHYVLESCASPIEQLFVGTMMSEFMWQCDTLGVFHQDLAEAHGVHSPQVPGVLYSIGGDVAILQARVRDAHGEMVIDVGLLSESRRVAVELDGHDFHERTKEQARRDRARERRLIAMGWTVVRFTGSEVYQDAERSVREALAIFKPCSKITPVHAPVDGAKGGR